MSGLYTPGFPEECSREPKLCRYGRPGGVTILPARAPFLREGLSDREAVQPLLRLRGFLYLNNLRAFLRVNRQLILVRS